MLDPITGRMERYLDLVSARQKLVAANVANLDTPGYHTKDIDFQFEFMSLAEGATPRVVEPEGLRTNNDGNNVSLDREARLLAENGLRFGVVSTLLKTELRQIRNALTETRS